jgi:hypothetical protein
MYAREPLASHRMLLGIRDFIARHVLLIVALASLAILIVVWWPTSFQRSSWPGQPLITEPNRPGQNTTPPPPAQISGDAHPIDSNFNLIVENGLYPNDRAAISKNLKQTLDYVIERFGGPPAHPFTAALVFDERCQLHGIAYTDMRIIQVFTCNNIPSARAVAIMAHEFVHQLQQDRYGQAHAHADIILVEGAATWAAGKYWLGDQPDFRAYVRHQRSVGAFYPLATDYTGLDVGAMNALYFQWASFVDFLITTYGREKFDQLYITGQGSPGTSDYTRIYGKGLDTIEQEWKAWLDT